MAESVSSRSVRAGFFSTAAKADDAVRRLLAAGFTKDEVGVICPEKFKSEFHPDVERVEHNSGSTASAVGGGGALGLALGGIALATTAIATGGVGLLPAVPVLLGGGAIAGSFSSLILSEGYDNGIVDFHEQALSHNKIVVGVELQGDNIGPRLAQAARVLEEAGAEQQPQ